MEGFVMYKSQLQEYAQKAGLMPPTYDHVKEGASHEPRFKSTVWVNSQSYESAPGYSTLRSAEHAAAKAALDFLQKSQTAGVVPSPVHESGLCKNLLQEFAQKNGYPLPQYKVIRQGEEHSLTFTATVDIASVSYSGGGAKSKKEAEIKAARTALLAIQATQPEAWEVLEPSRPLPAQAQPGQIANFVKSHPKRKKRGRANPQVIEEPLATRMKQCVGQIPGPMQIPGPVQIPGPMQFPGPVQMMQMPQMHQMHQVHQLPQVSQIPHFLPVTQVTQSLPVDPAVGQNGMPVEWKQEYGVNTTAEVVVQSQETGQTLDRKSTNVEDHRTTPSVETDTAVNKAHEATLKVESATAQQVPLTADVVHVTSVSTSEVLLAQPQHSAVPATLHNSVNGEPIPLVNGKIQKATAA